MRGRPLHECKRGYLARFGLAARRFNAVEVNLRGKVNAAEEAQKLQIDQLKGAIAAAEKA